MTKITREAYVAQSFWRFIASAFASVGFLIGGVCYLAINQGSEGLPEIALKIAGIEFILLIVTYACWHNYKSDKKLLYSSKNKYMNAKTSNVDTSGISLPDIDADS